MQIHKKNIVNSKAGFLILILLFMTSILIIHNSCKRNKNLPELNTYTITTITESNAICGGNITSDGGKKITARGVCWSTNEHPTVADNKTNDGKGTGSFNSTITGFSTNTKYYVRAYATNKNGTAYGTEVTFIKQSSTDNPAITTYAAIAITQSSATSGGNITSDGGSEIIARGICWSTTENPVITDSHTSNGTGKGIFVSNITGLSSGITYYVRAYATNSLNTVYGNQISFTTPGGLLPIVTTTNVTSITNNSAISGGNISSGGSASVTAKGICWSTTQNPTISNFHTSDGNGIDSFTSIMNSLTSNTTYYVRAYATNIEGTAYGNEISFTTRNMQISTTIVSNITNTTANSGGIITGDGGSPVTERGVCWATSTNPLISGNHTSDGSGTGTFSSNITGLTPNTLYYLRAYAINGTFTAYGNEISFTTASNIPVPTLTTNPISQITQISAAGGGNIVSDGGSPVITRGICWSTNSSPTISDSFTSNGSGIGYFSSSLSNLNAGATYYVRAYATNNTGTF